MSFFVKKFSLPSPHFDKKSRHFFIKWAYRGGKQNGENRNHFRIFTGGYRI